MDVEETEADTCGAVRILNIKRQRLKRLESSSDKFYLLVRSFIPRMVIIGFVRTLTAHYQSRPHPFFIRLLDVRNINST